MAEEKKEYQIGQQILTQEDINKKITVDGEAFMIKLPSPSEQERIEREIALRLGGSPLESYPQTMYNNIRMNVTLDSVITDAPEWWKGTGECYNEDLLTKIWEQYLKLREDFRRSLRQGKFKRKPKVSS
jgi:hypothetical protein